MELVGKSCSRRTIFQDHGHPISRTLETSTFGDSYAFGPLLVLAVQRFDASHRAVSLGAKFLYYELDRPGLFVVDQGGVGLPEILPVCVARMTMRGATSGRKPMRW